MKEEISIDNKINEKKNDIKKLDNEIYYEKKLLNSYNDREEATSRVKNIVNDIAYYLGLSIKGERVNRIIQDMRESNQLAYRNTMNEIDEERLQTKNRISKIYDEKDEIQKEINKMYSELEAKNNNERTKQEDIKLEEIKHPEKKQEEKIKNNEKPA